MSYAAPTANRISRSARMPLSGEMWYDGASRAHHFQFDTRDFSDSTTIDVSVGDEVFIVVYEFTPSISDDALNAGNISVDVMSTGIWHQRASSAQSNITITTR